MKAKSNFRSMLIVIIIPEKKLIVNLESDVVKVISVAPYEEGTGVFVKWIHAEPHGTCDCGHHNLRCERRKCNNIISKVRIVLGDTKVDFFLKYVRLNYFYAIHNYSEEGEQNKPLENCTLKLLRIVHVTHLYFYL